MTRSSLQKTDRPVLVPSGSSALPRDFSPSLSMVLTVLVGSGSPTWSRQRPRTRGSAVIEWGLEMNWNALVMRGGMGDEKLLLDLFGSTVQPLG